MKTEFHSINSFEDLLHEKQRLLLLIENQKNIIRHDFQVLREQAKKQVKPAIDAAKFVKSFSEPGKRNQTIFRLGLGLAIDVTSRMLFSKSNLLVRTVVPMVAKSFSQRFLNKNNRP